jgi:fatty-acyl-CoA synthase
VKGLMQDFPLTIHHFFWRAEKLFGEKEIVSKLPEGLHRYTFADFTQRVRRLAGALLDAGVKPGDRVASFAWNHHRHQELYFAVPMVGAVLHTLNIRLHHDQVAYIVDHAEDRLIFFDASLAEELEPVAERAASPQTYVRMGEGEAFDSIDYEDLLESAEPLSTWPDVDEDDAAAMCYTSGTTGNPRGVVYSHRSIFLHTFGVSSGNVVAFAEDDVNLAIVPMFHAMAWGHPYAATMAGAKQVYPGPFLDPGSLCELISSEMVTVAAAVPTIWIGVLEELQRGGHDFSSVRSLVGGGAAVPRSLIAAFRDRHGIELVQGWGMTETSPVGAHGFLKTALRELPPERQLDYRAKTGFTVPGVELRVVGEDGEEVTWDGESVGEIQVRGPWIASSYYKDSRSEESFQDGWLKTGDVATVDELGYFQIVDRTKDLVKSGGEWISSVELEKEIMGHPAVLEAAVIGVEHSKWGERPLACVVLRDGAAATEEEILGHLEGKFAKWWMPDGIVFIEEVPKTSVGKFDKKVLREKFAGYRLNTDD